MYCNFQGSRSLLDSSVSEDETMSGSSLGFRASSRYFSCSATTLALSEHLEYNSRSSEFNERNECPQENLDK